MKKVLLGLVIAVMMTGSGNAKYFDLEYGKTKDESIIQKLLDETVSKALYKFSNYEKICNEIKDEIRNELLFYFMDKELVDALYSNRYELEELDSSISSEIDKQLEIYKSNVENRYSNLSEMLTLSNIYSTFCKD